MNKINKAIFNSTRLFALLIVGLLFCSQTSNAASTEALAKDLITVENSQVQQFSVGINRIPYPICYTSEEVKEQETNEGSEKEFESDNQSINSEVFQNNKFRNALQILNNIEHKRKRVLLYSLHQSWRIFIFKV